jgi:hypothetical protein
MMNIPILNRKLILVLSGLLFVGCATSLPKERHEVFRFPSKLVYLDEPIGENLGRPFEILGWVRSKAYYPTLEQDNENPVLCRNYYNKAANDLLKEALKAKADAVIKVRSIIFLLDGKYQEHSTPECTDDGAEGEVLLKGIAIRWKPKASEVR